MANDQCQCGQPLNEQNRCSCDPEFCKECCKCELDCQCGCKNK